MNYTKGMTPNIAQTILSWLNCKDWHVTAIYEDSFKATRNNEWFLGELNIELMAPWKYIDSTNVYNLTLTVTHVLRRYK